VRGYRAGDVNLLSPISFIIWEKRGRNTSLDLSAECALFFGVSDRTIIRREAKKGLKNPFVPLPSPATPPPSLRFSR